MVEPRRFQTVQEAEQWLGVAFQAWASSLSPEERDAVAEYKGSAYRWLNAMLREDALDDAAQDLAMLLDDAIARGSVPEPVVVYRGFASGQLADLFEFLPGAQITDPGYWSTSLIRPIAIGFLQSIEDVDDEERLLAEILVPAGTPAAAPDVIDECREAEILLVRATAFRVHAVHERDEQRPYRTLDLEVIT